MEYELLDFGNMKRLERIGGHLLVRPDVRASGSQRLSSQVWLSAQAEFVSSLRDQGAWRITDRSLPREWFVDCLGLRLLVRLRNTKQIGFFPEHFSEWEHIEDFVRGASRPVRFLNLFGYTGVASLFASRAGAAVTHVDSSRTAILWGKDMEKASHLQDGGIRWVVEDVPTFVRREIKRGSFYDAIVLDPPPFGRGLKGEVWQFESMIKDLLLDVSKLLSHRPVFLILNVYTDSSKELVSLNWLNSLFHSKKPFSIIEERLFLNTSSGLMFFPGTTSFTLVWNS